jgi:hypothetical protein
MFRRVKVAGAIFLLIIGFRAAVQAQRFQPVRYLGEIGHLKTKDDHRPLADFGSLKVFPGDTGEANFIGRSDSRLEGRDQRGRPWRAIISTSGGVGWTDVWEGDFDANGRKDLMIAAHMPGNGRCTNLVDLTFLLFDTNGWPLPWSIETYLPKSGGPGKIPAILRDVNRDGRAELVATDCSYADGERFGEDRGITGIYESRDGRWSLIRPPDLNPYLAAVKANHSHGFVYFTRPHPARWSDLGNATTLNRIRATITKLLPADPNCGGVRLEVVDGRVQVPVNDPCNELGVDRFVFSDGMVCYGQPTAIIDAAGTREIIDARLEGVLDAWRRMVQTRLPVTALGSVRENRCTPSLLWASDGS